jgi:hypothetical protein
MGIFQDVLMAWLFHQEKPLLEQLNEHSSW